MEKKILKRIELSRRKLYKFGRSSDLVSHEVVKASQKLDSLLNQYQKLISYKQLSFWEETIV